MLEKKLMENILVFLIAGVVALIGFAMLFYEFIAEDYRTKSFRTRESPDMNMNGKRT